MSCTIALSHDATSEFGTFETWRTKAWGRGGGFGIGKVWSSRRALYRILLPAMFLDLARNPGDYGAFPV